MREIKAEGELNIHAKVKNFLVQQRKLIFGRLARPRNGGAQPAFVIQSGRA